MIIIARSPALDDVIAKITPENLHKPIFKDPVNTERWSFSPGPRLGRAEP